VEPARVSSLFPVASCSLFNVYWVRELFVRFERPRSCTVCRSFNVMLCPAVLFCMSPFLRAVRVSRVSLQVHEDGETHPSLAYHLPPLNAAAAAAAAQAAAQASAAACGGAASPTGRSLAPKRSIGKPRGRPPRHTQAANARLLATANNDSHSNQYASVVAVSNRNASVHQKPAPSGHSADNARATPDVDTAHSHDPVNFWDSDPSNSNAFHCQPMHAGVTTAAPVAKGYLPPVTAATARHVGIRHVQPVLSQGLSDSSTIPPASMSASAPGTNFARRDGMFQRDLDDPEYSTPNSQRSPPRDLRPTTNPEEWDLTNVTNVICDDDSWMPHACDADATHDAALWAAVVADDSPVPECCSESQNHGSSESDTGMVPAEGNRRRYEAGTFASACGDRGGARLLAAHRRVKSEQADFEKSLFDSHPSPQVFSSLALKFPSCVAHLLNELLHSPGPEGID
jgi:hypothetical protein